MKLMPLMIFFIGASFSCAYLAIKGVTKKEASIKRTQHAIDADIFFWDQFHAGNYHNIDQIIILLQAAFLKDPNDWQTAAHLGFTYIWRFAERNRISKIMPTIVNDAIISLWYFEEAFKLRPQDARLHGFIADLKMALGSIQRDERKIREGYFDGLAAIKKWPEFNLFTIGYGVSGLDYHSQQFQKAIDWQWQTLKLCSDEKIDRENLDYSKFMQKEETDKLIRRKSVCWNSWIAPHNLEGFFLNMGDMLVKNGEVETAIKIYKNAKLSKDYVSWPYASVLENRIKNAKQNVKNFRSEGSGKNILLNSTYSCMACHQANP